MDFRYADEHVQFADAVRRWASQRYDFDTRQAILATPAGTSTQAWRELAELGALAAPLPEAFEGMGMRTLDLLPMLVELGRGMVAEPFQASWLAARCIALSGGHPVLADVAAGQVHLAAALGERDGRHDLMQVGTTARTRTGGYVLDGVKHAVVHGAQADHLVVSARTAGHGNDRDGLSLFLVPATAPGVRRTDAQSLDGQRVATIELRGVQVDAQARLGSEGDAGSRIEAAADYGCALLCGEAVGLLERVHDDTLEYLKTRRQFGVPIGSFQVLQHRMADMTTHLAQARSITLLALAGVDGEDATVRRRQVSAAKARVGKAMRFVGQQGIQMHGGMGMTRELAMTHAVRRMTAIELTLGDTEHHLRRFQAQAETPAAALQVAA